MIKEPYKREIDCDFVTRKCFKRNHGSPLFDRRNFARYRRGASHRYDITKLLDMKLCDHIVYSILNTEENHSNEHASYEIPPLANILESPIIFSLDSLF